MGIFLPGRVVRYVDTRHSTGYTVKANFGGLCDPGGMHVDGAYDGLYKEVFLLYNRLNG